MTRRNDTIKTIAMITMLIDHIGVLLFPGIRVLRTIGRIAFPIFAYQVAKGYKHTSNKRKYATRMLIFGLISQIPYTFLNKQVEAEFFHLNVILLFLYSIGVLYLLDLSKSNIIYKKIIYLTLLVITTLIPNILEYSFEAFAFSYASYGIVMILIFYIFDDKWIPITISYLLLTVIYTYDSAVSYISLKSLEWFGTEASYFETFKRFNYIKDFLIKYDLKKLEIFWFQSRSLMALPIIYIFERVFNNIKLNKYIAYTFYPLHITILLIIRLIIGSPIM